MRAVRIVAMLLAALVLVVGIAVAVMNHYRDGIARRVAANLLDPYEIRVDDVTVGSVGAERIELDLVVLRRDDGLRVLIEGARLPVSASGLEGQGVDVDRVVIEPAAGRPDEAAADIAAIVERLLALPELLPEFRVDVASLNVSGYPELTGLSWQSYGGAQAFIADVDGLRLAADLEAMDAAERSTGSITASVGDEEAIETLFALERVSDGYQLEGSLALAIVPMLPILVRAGLVPEEVSQLNAHLSGSAVVTVSGGETPLATVALRMSPDGVADAAFRDEDGPATAVRLLEGAEAELDFKYPSGDWGMAVAEAHLHVNHDGFPGLRLRVQDLVCSSSLECTMRGDFEPVTIANGVNLGGSVEGLALSSPDGGWRVRIAEASIDVGGISGPADLKAALSVSASDIVVDGAETVQGELEMGSPDIELLGHKIAIPGARGVFSRTGDELALTLKLGEVGEALSADLSLAHNLSNDTTRLTLDDAQIDFSGRSLSALIEGWPNEWDLVGGNWRGNGVFLRGKDGSVEFSAHQVLDAVAGSYGDIAFTGLNAELSAAEGAWPPAEPQAVSLSVDVVDVGFPLRSLETVLTVDAGSGRMAVDDTRMEALGGSVAVEPFVFDPEVDTLRVVLRPDAVQLPLMADLANFEALKVLGSVSGVIPVTIGPNGVIVDNGRLIGDAPGGTIRYEATGCTDEVMQARIGLDYARCVLTYYEFDSLTSDLSYSEDGNLVIDMRLEGTNPQHDPDQPVNLNPTLTTNVIDLIRSLQAARSIEDVFNRQAN